MTEEKEQMIKQAFDKAFNKSFGEDKVIIVNGVNVAGCEHMLNNKIKGKQHCPAKSMHYAKETSCVCRKSIDTPYNFCKHNPNCHYKQLKRLEQGNKELKEKYTHVLELAKQNADSNEYCLRELEQKYEQLHSALEEIRNIIQNYESKEWNCFNDMDVKLEEISKVINEVLGEN